MLPNDLTGAPNRRRCRVPLDVFADRVVLIRGQHRDDAVDIQSVVSAKISVCICNSICKRMQFHQQETERLRYEDGRRCLGTVRSYSVDRKREQRLVEIDGFVGQISVKLKIAARSDARGRDLEFLSRRFVGDRSRQHVL